MPALIGFSSWQVLGLGSFLRSPAFNRAREISSHILLLGGVSHVHHWICPYLLIPVASFIVICYVNDILYSCHLMVPLHLVRLWTP